MATCKDCLSYDICSYHAATKAMHGLIEEKLVYIANQIPCKFFKSKSHYVEIPCYCKECKHSVSRSWCSKYECTKLNGEFRYSNDFCSYGERRCEE